MLSLRRLPRWAVRLPLAAAACLLALVALVQLALLTPLLRTLLNRASPDHFHIEYDTAWSPWPGRLHVNGLRLRAQDHNVQWELQVDGVDATIRLVDLLRRKFHPTRVRASGVGFKLRRKIFRPEADDERLYGLPAIDGFGPVPFKDEQPRDLVPDSRYRLWTVHLEDVAAERVREIWIDRARFRGEAQATGGFFIKPMRRVQVEAQLQAGALRLDLGDDAFLDKLRGRLAITVHPFDPRMVPGRLKLRQVSALVRMDGDVLGVEFLQRALHGQVELHGGRGPLRLDLSLERGVFSQGVLEATLARVRAAAGKLRARGDAHVMLRAERDGAQPMTRASLEVASLTVASRADGAQPARARTALILAGTEPFDLLTLPHLRELSLDVHGGEVPDLRLLRAVLPAKADALVDGGSALLEAHLEGTAQETHGHAELTVRDALVSGGGLRVRASALGNFLLHGGSPFAPLQLSGSRLRVHHADVIHGDTSSAPGWWGDFRLTSGQLDLSARSIALQLDARCRDARPLVGLFTASGKVPKIVAGLFHMDHLHLAGGLRVAPGLFELERLDAQGGKSVVRANYEKMGDARHGEALLSFHGLSVGLDLHQKGLSIVLIKPGSWYADRLRREELIKRERGKKRLSAIGYRLSARSKSTSPRRR